MNDPGIIFDDVAAERRVKLVTEGPWAGWLMYEDESMAPLGEYGQSGPWITIRRATEEEGEAITAGVQSAECKVQSATKE